MATATSSSKLSGLARSLIQEKLLSEEDAHAIQTQANAAKNPFITQLILSKKLNPQIIAQTSALAFGFPYFDLDAFDAEQLPVKQIDINLMQMHRVMGLQVRNNVLFVAVSDPSNLHALDSVQFLMGMSLSPVVVEDDKLGKWIAKLVAASDSSMSTFALADDALDVLEQTYPGEDSELQTPEIDDAPVVKFLNKMLLDAIHMGASDLHFEPYEKFYRVRYRIDGILREIS